MEHGKSYCKDSVGIEEQMFHAAICRCLAKMKENDQEVLALIQSNLSYVVSGNDVVIDVFTVERQIYQLKDPIGCIA